MLADLAWLSSRPTRDALHPAPLAKALLHLHRARCAACGFKTSWRSCVTSVTRTHARFAPWITGRRPWSTRSLSDLAWLSSQPTRDALHRTPMTKALEHRHRARPAAAASNRRGHCVRVFAARPTRASPHGQSANDPRSTRSLSDLMSLSSQPTRDALYLTPLAEALLH